MTKNKELDGKIANSVYGSDFVAEETAKKISEEKETEAKTSVFELENESPTGSQEPKELVFEESDGELDFNGKKNDKKPKRNFIKNAIIAFLSIVLLSAVAWGAMAVISQRENPTEPVVKTESGKTTWKMVESTDPTSTKWFVDGYAPIQNATNDEEAKNAAASFVDDCKTDPVKLVGLAKTFLNETVAKADLVDVNGYATDKAVDLATNLSLEIARAKVVVADAPANGYNSGINNGVAVQSDTAGITGDRKAIQISMANGQTVWVMARCGNPVTASSVGLPTGQTDNPIPPVPTEELTPKSSNPLDYPYPRGDDGTTDSGTGVKPPVAEVTTPAETTPPAVEVTTPGGGGVVDTPTTTPGEETGVTAPGVETPPTTEPAVVTPSEPETTPEGGGDNTPEISNPF